MALEVLKDIKEIGGFEVGHVICPLSVTEYAITRPVVINHHKNFIGFKIQNGPIKEVGVNGVQVDTLIEAAKMIIEGFQKNFPCRENSVAITKLDEALLWLLKRKLDREKRGVEGKSEA